jgi:hypothetical protein
MPEIFRNKPIPELGTQESQRESNQRTFDLSSQMAASPSRNSRFTRTSSQKPARPKKNFGLLDDKSEERMNTQMDSDYRSKQEYILKNVYSERSLK